MDSFLPSTSWIVSGWVNETLTASSSPTSFKASGLPPGLKLDAKTGVLSGRPTAAGDFLVLVTATNEAGTGPPMLMVAYVSPVPGLTAGSFAGVVGRADLYGQRSLGGQLRFTISTGRGGLWQSHLWHGHQEVHRPSGLRGGAEYRALRADFPWGRASLP